MLTSAPVLGGRLEIDLRGASVNLVMGTSADVKVTSEAPVTIGKMWLNRGRIVRWTNDTTQRSGGSISVSNTGTAYASGGGIANTGIIGSMTTPATPNGGNVTIEVPVEVAKITIKNAANYTAASDLQLLVSDKR